MNVKFMRTAISAISAISLIWSQANRGGYLRSTPSVRSSSKNVSKAQLTQSDFTMIQFSIKTHLIFAHKQFTFERKQNKNTKRTVRLWEEN